MHLLFIKLFDCAIQRYLLLTLCELAGELHKHTYVWKPKDSLRYFSRRLSTFLKQVSHLDLGLSVQISEIHLSLLFRCTNFKCISPHPAFRLVLETECISSCQCHKHFANGAKLLAFLKSIFIVHRLWVCISICITQLQLCPVMWT